jgi:hypothetical protein
MEKFSIVSFYWGNKKNLDSYVAHASEYTDDIVIVNIDLLNSFESFGNVKVVNVPFDYLFHNGHDDILNLANKHTKYDWVYYLAVGKRIVNINYELMNKYPNTKWFYDKELNNPIDKWIKFYDKNYTHWHKKVHESIELLPNIEHINCEDIILEWERQSNGNSLNGQYTYDEREKIIYENFRQFTRLKWVFLETDYHILFSKEQIKNVIIYYNEFKSVYNMEKEELIEYLYNNDCSFTM